MITRIQALNYRCLRYVDQELKPFQLLVGANATGKTTFLEVVSFMGDLVAKGVEAAIRERSSNPDDLLWKRQGDAFELAIEVAIPDDVRSCIEDPGLSHVRYEVAVKTDIDGEGIGLSGETVWLTRGNEREE